MKVLLGLSGGLDSTYAALRLKEAGYEVEGAVLDMHCFTELDAARAAASALKIPIRVLSCRALFDRTVVENFCDEYMAGRTPNPCIVCNEKVKFRALYEEALRSGFDRIATGHYAKVVERNGACSVAMAADPKKDQSYMLYRLPQDILSKLLLPLGDITKEEVRSRARSHSLSVADRDESQEICFVQGESYADFIERRRGASETGIFLDENGNVLGRHKGIVHYTVGQRKGLGVSAQSRLFITEIHPETGDIILSSMPPKVISFTLKDVYPTHAIRKEIETEGEGAPLLARVRYTATLTPAYVKIEQGNVHISLAENTCAVTPGQSAVFYRNGEVLFGGVVEKLL